MQNFSILISDLKSAQKTDLRNTLLPEVALIFKKLTLAWYIDLAQSRSGDKIKGVIAI